MLTICPYFHVHQPHRIKRYRVFDIGNDSEYFNANDHTDLNNERILRKVAGKSYIPTTALLKELLDKHPEFRFSLSFSGTVLDQFEAHMPEVLKAFQDLVATGRVEVLADTYYHSLAFFYSRPEFERQVALHKKRIQDLFEYTPRVFRNTELSYTNSLAKWCEDNGYLGIMAEGWDPVLGWRSPNYVYTPKGCSSIKVLLKNYKLSDDIAFRFGNKGWESWPLSADTYAKWLHAHHGDGQTINLFMDFETFGEHQWEDTGIFDFLRALPEKILAHGDTSFKTPSETALAYEPVGEIDVPHILTWADTDRDLTAWVGNDIQRDAIGAIYGMEESVLKTGDPVLIETWRKLQTSDHFYYMCTKWFQDGDVHAYFSPYESPYDAYIAFMNALSDLQLRVSEASRRNEETQVSTKKRFWSRVWKWLHALVRKFIGWVSFIRDRMRTHTS
ncbi:MAG: glycoside hydrolase family 57 protein [Candidatus Kaiserbacteria bacterium]|nr:glycoside hydrolase family 57 protein [Candidatus Kaiserbacteria bacterium]